MPDPRNVLTPEALTMMDAIATSGSFAAAARQLGKVPSALTYNVRQLEDALDVLLFDRRSRQATLTAAGQELLDEGRRLLAADGRRRQPRQARRHGLGDAAQHRRRRRRLALDRARPVRRLLRVGHATAPPTRLRLRTEVLAGTWEALVTGQADLAIGIATDRELPGELAMKELGPLEFVFAIAPQHPLAAAAEPLADAELVRHRAIAVADSAQRMTPVTVNLLPGQDVLTVSDMQAKIDALLRGIGCGFVPEPMVREHVAAGRLLVKTVQRRRLAGRIGYAWRTAAGVGREHAQAGTGTCAALVARATRQRDDAARADRALRRPRPGGG